jgi:acetyl-CoA carboxylase biotin carboxyl carrier protein
MDNKEIRELAALMREMGLTSLEYTSGGESIKLKRAAAMPYVNGAPADAVPAWKPADESVGGPAGTGHITVKSPMVGVFYSAPGVDAEPFVAIGDQVRPGDVLCIIEAMKIMNEITAEHDGVITGIYAENKQVVEFGQTLFTMRSDGESEYSAVAGYET